MLDSVLNSEKTALVKATVELFGKHQLRPILKNQVKWALIGTVVSSTVTIVIDVTAGVSKEYMENPTEVVETIKKIYK